MKNIPLLLFDLVCLPITIIRLSFIYFFGSRYNVPSLQFLDVMAHATNRYFNQGIADITVDTVPVDVRLSINRSSRVDPELITEIVREPTNRDRDRNKDRKSIFGQKGETTIVLRSDRSVSPEDISKLQKLLPKILSQISPPNDRLGDTNEINDINDINDIDISNIDASKLDKRLDDEIKKELDFLSYDAAERDDFILDSITDG
jgi:hypothetical protein